VSPTSRPRTSIRRLPELQRRDRADLDAVLDAGIVAHVAIVDDGQPYALPMAYVRDGDRLLLHGSRASRLVRTLAAGVPACVTVTLLDALVVARSAFESSMHYRSAMVLGRAAPVADPLEALARFTDGVLPGRWQEVRATRPQELAATTIVELPILEWSVKVSDGDPEDPPEDQELDVWAGVVPLERRYGEPRPSADLRPGIPVPASVERLRGDRRRGQPASAPEGCVQDGRS
jgi:uncharacterized protein